MPVIQRVLAEIFDYYHGSSTSAVKEKSMKSMKFQKMVLDADIIDEQLTSAKVDLIFRKVCGNQPHMVLSQFLDAVVQCATIKYPQLSPTEAVSQLYEDHFSSFTNPTESPVDSLDEQVLMVAEAALPVLQALYTGYFSMECSQHFKHTSTSVSAQSQKSFVQLLTDFEVTPDLISKPVTFQVYREAVKIRALPPEIEQRLPIATPGVHFTFSHFVCAMILLARKVFPEELCPNDAARIARLFERMDASKGRIAYATKFPGNARGSVSAIRLLPEGSAFAPEGGRRRSSLGLGAAPDGRRASVRRSVTASVGQGLPLDDAMADAEGDLEDAMKQRKVPERLRRLIQQVFGYYAALGDPLNRTYISTLKFNRFLRDCGLLSSDAHGAVSFKFNPAPRGSLTMKRGSVGGGGGGRPSMLRSGSDTELGGRRRSSLTAVPEVRRTSIRDAFTVSASRKSISGSAGFETSDSLPLRVFLEPPLSQVDADILFVQVTKVAESAGERRPSTGGLGERRGSATAAKNKKHMEMDAFEKALFAISDRCLQMGSLGNLTVQDDDGKAFEAFCEKVLVPLSEQLLEVQGQDVSEAAALMAQPDTVSLFERVQPGIERVFQHYAKPANEGGRAAYWSSESMVKFATDFELTSELSHLPLQKIFRDCVHVEYCAGHGRSGEMSLISFQLALVMLSQKIHASAMQGKLDKLVLLFHRMNTISAMNGFPGPVARQNALLPGLPQLQEASDYFDVKPSGRRSSLNAGAGGGGVPGGASWADIMGT